MQEKTFNSFAATIFVSGLITMLLVHIIVGIAVIHFSIKYW